MDLSKQNSELLKKIQEQKKLIEDMRSVLKFCARTDVGSYYQQNIAREMAMNNRRMIFERCNADGYTYNDEYRKWIFECGGQKALDRNDKEEASLK